MMTMCVQIAERRSHLTLTVSLLRAHAMQRLEMMALSES
jgi:hypothetical protein